MRKLASIREIKAIKDIDGADKIVCAIVDGWECVIAKKDCFNVGDKVVYIEIDSIVPERPEFEFLRDRKFRVRTIKLRKQISQGLVLPLTILPKGLYSIGDDVTEILGIRKYDPEGEQERRNANRITEKSKNPIIRFLMRFGWFRKLYIKPRKGNFPSWIVKTDEERIQNKVSMFEIEKELGTKFAVTEKLDGQSLTLFLERVRGEKFDFGVCSRNLRLSEPNDSSWWTIARQINAESVLRILLGNGNRIVLQGEIVGRGIQGNKYKVDGYDFYAFNLIIDGVKFSTQEMKVILAIHNIKTVPILEDNFILLDDIPKMAEYAEGKSVLCSTEREGVVVRNNEKNISFKVISPKFLLRETS